MALYQYKAVTPEGKLVEGTLEAANRQTALSRLQEQGQLPISVYSESDSGVMGRELTLPWRRSKVGQQDLLVFTQELSTLVRSGLPIDRSLTVMTEITDNEYLQGIVGELLQEIKAGKSLSEALGQFPQVFPRIYVNMIKAGEAGGALDVILERLDEYLQNSVELRNYFVSSLIYPAILAGVGLVSIVVMVAFVIPNFATIFENAGAPLPLPMKILMGVSAVFTGYGWLLALVALAGGLLLRRRLATEEGRLRWDRGLLRLPLLGSILLKREVSRFARTLGTLLNSAVPLIQSINIVKDIVGNQHVAAAMEPVKAGVKKGDGLTGPMRETGIFPPFAIHLLKVGEETGRLDQMLLQVADAYDRDLRNALRRLIALFEPAIILIMGILIGGMVVSMLYSIFSINEVPL